MRNRESGLRHGEWRLSSPLPLHDTVKETTMSMSSTQVETLINNLSSENQKTIVSAVETLSVAELRPTDQNCLIEIVSDFLTEESVAPLWSMVILKRQAPLSSIPALLAVLDSDYDYYREAAAEALVSIAQRTPEETLDLLEEFIRKRIDHDPWDARLFAYEPIAALKNNARAQSFLIEMFEADDQWRGSLGNDLAGFGDRRILVMLRRAIEFAELTKNQLDKNELRYAYARLAGAPVRTFDDLRLWRMPWTERWSHSLEELGKDQEAIEEPHENEPLNPLRRDAPAEMQEIKREQEVIAQLPLIDFRLDDYLAVRVRSELEERCDEALRLVGMDSDWTVEKVQRLMNHAVHPSEVIREISTRHEFVSSEALETFASVLVNLWNETPREELNGLSPDEMMVVSELRAENEEVERRREEWKKTLDDSSGTRTERSQAEGPKAQRNDPCPCGSGKKFKKCYLAKNPDCKLLFPHTGRG